MPFNPTAAAVWASGPTGNPIEPDKAEIRVWGRQLEAATDAIASGSGTISKQSQTQLNADLAHGADTMAWVYADSDVSKNGIYRKSGASGSGSWSFALPLPYTYIAAGNAGTGTPNAIQATSTVPVIAGMLVSVNIVATNTFSPVTIAFNSQIPLTIKTRSGQDVGIGDLTPGYILGVRLGSIFYLLSDTAVASLIYAARDAAFAARDDAQEAQAAAEAARDIAAGYASDAVSQGNVPIYGTVAGMPALAVPAGISVIRINGYYNATIGGAYWRRISLVDLGGYPARSYFRTQDRFLPSGTTDAVNGGYWVLDEADGNAQQLGALPDCTGVGIGTDVMPALEAAIAYAIKRFGDGAKVVLPAGRYRATTPKTFDLGGHFNVVFDLQGSITPDNTPMTVLTVQNANEFQINARVLEGGVFRGWLDPSPFAVDYSTVADVVAGGGQQFLQVEGVFGYTVDLRAKAYGGRVLRTTISTNPDFPQTGAIKGTIYTSRAYGDFSGARTAQSLWADPGPNVAAVGSGNWGGLSRLVDDFSFYPPVWVDLNDIEVNVIDAAYAKGGPVFRGCVVVEGDNWYVGGIDSNPTNKHVSFVPSSNRGSSQARVSKLRFLDVGNGLYADSLLFASFPDVQMAGSVPFLKLAELINCVDVEVNVTAPTAGAQLVDISGGATDRIRIGATGIGAISSDQVVIESSVNGYVHIDKPVLSDAAAGKSLIRVDGAANVLVSEPFLSSATGNIFDIASASNNVVVHGGEVIGAANKYESGIEPVAVVGVTNIDTKISGNVRANSGGNSGGAGGAFQLGLSTPAFAAYAPMAQIKAKLLNSVASELQGGLSMQFRPVGVAGQALLDGFEVSQTTTDGETVGILMARISGSHVAKRVKVGAAGTGPGGFGQALYI